MDALAHARLGERWVVRHRLADGSATDVIGWIEKIERESISVATSGGRVVRLAMADIILARRAPAAAGGPDPLRTTAEELERYALPGWLGFSEPLGEWTLRAARGFTSRANSCLAVGDPGMPLGAAAAKIVAFSGAHGIPPQSSGHRGLPDRGGAAGARLGRRLSADRRPGLPAERPARRPFAGSGGAGCGDTDSIVAGGVSPQPSGRRGPRNSSNDSGRSSTASLRQCGQRRRAGRSYRPRAPQRAMAGTCLSVDRS